MYEVDSYWIKEILLDGRVFKIKSKNKKDIINKYKTLMSRIGNEQIISNKPSLKRKRTIKKKSKSKGKNETFDKIKRKKFTSTDKWTILHKQSYKCNLCKKEIGKEGPEFDHIIPLQYGGPDDVNNLQCLCIKCHSIKTQKVDNKVLSILIPEYIKKVNLQIPQKFLPEIQNKIKNLQLINFKKSDIIENIENIDNINNIEKMKKNSPTINYITNNYYFCSCRKDEDIYV